MNGPQNVFARRRCQFDYRSLSDGWAVNYDSESFDAELTTARKMKDEMMRLTTYAKWSSSSCQIPATLAEAGFFFTGISDRVKCAFCLGVLKKWQPEDIPLEEHKKHFPYCKFIKGKDVGNIPIMQTGIEQVLDVGRRKSSDKTSACDYNFQHEARSHACKTPVRREDITKHPASSGLPTLLEQKTSLYNFHISNSKSVKSPADATTSVTKPPSSCTYREEQGSPPASQQRGYRDKTVDYTVEANRLLSFLGWPEESTLLPEDAARAGFYFVPTDTKPDRVKCGYCGGKLFGWQEGDDPMIEHARCFPACPYIRLCIGEETLDAKSQVLQKYNDQCWSDNSTKQIQTSREYVEKSGDISSLQSTRRRETHLSDVSTNRADDDVGLVMRSDTVQAVLAMGFPKQKVIQTVRGQMEKGKLAFSVTELLDVLL